MLLVKCYKEGVLTSPGPKAYGERTSCSKLGCRLIAVSQGDSQGEAGGIAGHGQKNLPVGPWVG